MKRDLAGKLRVQAVGGDPDQTDELVFDAPENYTVGAVANRATEFENKIKSVHVRVSGKQSDTIPSTLFKYTGIRIKNRISGR